MTFIASLSNLYVLLSVQKRHQIAVLKYCQLGSQLSWFLLCCKRIRCVTATVDKSSLWQQVFFHSSFFHFYTILLLQRPLSVHALYQVQFSPHTRISGTSKTLSPHPFILTALIFAILIFLWELSYSGQQYVRCSQKSGPYPALDGGGPVQCFASPAGRTSVCPLVFPFSSEKNPCMFSKCLIG